MIDMLRTSLVLERSELRLIDESLPITGFANRDVLFGEALVLYMWTVGQMRQERIIVAIDQSRNQYRRLTMPPLDQSVPPDTVPPTTGEDNRPCRIFVQLARETVERMDNRRDVFGYSSRADMLSRCKTVYLAALEACRNKRHFASVDTKTSECTIAGYPFLSRAFEHYTH